MTERNDFPVTQAATRSAPSSSVRMLLECGVCLSVVVVASAFAVGLALIVPFLEIPHALCATGILVIALGIVGSIREG